MVTNRASDGCYFYGIMTTINLIPANIAHELENKEGQLDLTGKLASHLWKGSRYLMFSTCPDKKGQETLRFIHVFAFSQILLLKQPKLASLYTLITEVETCGRCSGCYSFVHNGLSVSRSYMSQKSQPYRSQGNLVNNWNCLQTFIFRNFPKNYKKSFWICVKNCEPLLNDLKSSQYGVQKQVYFKKQYDLALSWFVGDNTRLTNLFTSALP